MHIWAEIFKWLSKKERYFNLSSLLDYAMQPTDRAETREITPKSKIGTISVFFKNCPEPELQKVILKARVIFF